jgi:CMP-N,N'-diacetyllegionaminic acid synthase
VKKVYAIITARGGSKGLLGKNLRLLNGKPLIAYSILAARGCPYISRCIVSTEDDEIRRESIKWGAEVIDRPHELATDNALSQDVVRHVLEKLRSEKDIPDFFTLLQPTSPLRTAEHLKSCLDAFFKADALCTLSVTEAEHHPYKAFITEGDILHPFFDIESLDKPRQTLPKVYRQNGAIYVINSEIFLKENTFFVPPVLPFVMGREESIDIDTEFDLRMAQLVMACKGAPSALKSAVRYCGKPIDLKGFNRDINWRRQIAADQKAVADRLFTRRQIIDKCPVCSSAGASPFVTVYNYDYATCDNCGHLFCKTPPSPDAINTLYAGNESERTIQGKIYIDEKIFGWRVEQIARPKVAFVKKILSIKGLWVDIGCGTGELLTAAGDAGWHVRGIEADPDEAEFGRGKGLDINIAYVTHDNAGKLLEGASVVSLINVLEHIVEPMAFLNSVTSVLSHGSYVVIEVPRHPSLSSFNVQAFPNLAARHIYPPDHLHIFSERSAEIMLISAKLTPVAIWSFGQDFYDLVSAAATNAGLDKSSYYIDMLEGLPGIQQALDDSGFSDTILIIARKDHSSYA